MMATSPRQMKPASGPAAQAALKVGSSATLMARAQPCWFRQLMANCRPSHQKDAPCLKLADPAGCPARPMIGWMILIAGIAAYRAASPPLCIHSAITMASACSNHPDISPSYWKCSARVLSKSMTAKKTRWRPNGMRPWKPGWAIHAAGGKVRRWSLKPPISSLAIARPRMSMPVQHLR